MLTGLKRWSHALASTVPSVLVCGLLAAVAYWGHETGWKAPKFSTLIGATADDDDDQPKGEPAEGGPQAGTPKAETTPGPPDWCPKHEVPDSLCTACHPELLISKYPPPPTAGLAVTPSHKPQECTTHLEIIRFPSQDALKNSGVQVEPVREQTITDTVTAYSEIDYDPVSTFKLSTRATGTVWRVYKHLGERVRAGDVLALVEAAEVGKAKAEYLQAVVQLSTRTNTLKLLQSGSPAERTRQDAESAVREAKAHLFTTQQALLNFGLPLRGDETTLPDDELAKRLQFLGIPADIVASLQTDTATANLLPVIAPRGGTIIERKAEAGETVSTLHPTPMFVISDVEHVHAHVDLRPEDVARLAVGMRCAFKPDSDDRVSVGPLEWIATAVDEKTRLVHAHVHLHNHDGRLRANLFGTTTITVAEHEKAVVVPAAAVQWEGCCDVVFVRDNKDELVFRPRKVVLGLRQNGVVEVLVGRLQPGEVIATTGSHVLKSYLFRDRLGSAD